MIKDDIKVQTYVSFLTLLRDSDLAMKLAACKSLCVLIDDVHLNQEYCVEFVPICFQSVQVLQEFDSKIQILYLLSVWLLNLFLELLEILPKRKRFQHYSTCTVRGFWSPENVYILGYARTRLSNDGLRDRIREHLKPTNADSFLLYEHFHFEILYNNDRVIEISVQVFDITEDKEIEADFTYSVKWVDRGDSDSIWTADG